MARRRPAGRSQEVAQVDLLLHCNEVAHQALDGFLAVPADDPAACLAFCDAACWWCLGTVEEERDRECHINRCDMRNPDYFRAQQQDIRALYDMLAHPELLRQEHLELLNQRTWNNGTATPRWILLDSGAIIFSFAADTLLSRLHAGLTLYLAGRVGAIFSHLSQWNAKEMAQLYARADDTLEKRQRQLAKDLEAREVDVAEIARLLGRDRGTIAKWLGRAP